MGELYIKDKQLLQELKEAMHEHNKYWDNFNNATREYIDTSIAELNASDEKIKALIKEIKSTK